MDFCILGPLEVRDQGRLVELRRKKQRALLALLLLRPGEIVSNDVLIDGLWGEKPPRTAKAALQNYVSQLRHALGQGVLVSRASGYLLEIAPEQIDLGRFERLAAEGRAAAGKERAEKLRQALAHWRGPPLADLLFEPFAAVESGRLEELRTAALEDLVDAELALGAGPGLVDELESLIAEHPFRERFRGQLMLALYRAGRQAEALKAFQATRRALVDELGIEPSAPLRELEQAILRQDASLAAPVRMKEVAAPQEARRKTVTVLFADLSFTVALDPELLREMIADALTNVRGVLESHGATIEQRAGDQVMAVFGVPRSHEDDALRAARAALQVQAQVAAPADALESDLQRPVELRVGIETGEVLAGADEAGHGFVAGPAITLAKRLQQIALPEEILVGPATLRLLGDAVVTEPADYGRDDAFRIFEVLEGVPPLARHLEAPLVGRRVELAALHEAFARVVDERTCRLVLILGEAGIGKTRLANELTTELDVNATVLVGRCVSYGKGATYLPLAEIIRELRARGELRRLLAADEHAELVAARLAELTGVEEASGTGSGETFWAVRRLFEALAGERPVLLVFEDLHWAEPTLLDLIEYLTERVAGAPVLLLGLARPELLDERSEWTQAETTRLAPLSSEEGAALIQNLADVPGELRTQIVRTAGGNPLFLEQLLVHTTENNELDTLPPSLDALLASRIDHLETGELSVLQRAAVAGREFSQGAVVRLLGGEDAVTVGGHLSALVRKGLIEESPEPEREDAFRFHHVLIREAAYATLPKAQRAELHERFARWLETRPTSSDELIGFHLEQALRYRTELGPVDARARRLAVDAGKHLGAAGLRAAKRSDVHAASNLLTRASALLDAREIARRDLLTELGLVVWRGGDLEAVEQVLGRSLETADSAHDRRSTLRAQVELANLRLAREPEGGAAELISLGAEATPVLEQLGDDRALGRLWYVLAFVHGGLHCQYRESAKAAERALHHFRQSKWPLAPCLQELAAGLYYGPTSVPDGIRRCRGLIEEADRGGEANVLAFLAGLEAMAGRFDSARNLASRARTIYEELAWTVNLSTNYAAVAADIEVLAGDDAEAERLLRESCAKLEAWGEQGHLSTQATQLGEALYSRGHYDEAIRWSEIAEQSAASDDASAQFLWRALRAKARARQGAADEAEALAREGVERAAATDAVSQRAHVLLAYAEVLRVRGRFAAAATAIEEAISLLDKKENVAGSDRARSQLAEVAGG